MNAIATIGRPSSFDPDTAQRICEHVADGGSVETILKELSMSSATLSRWLARDDSFRNEYAQAKLIKADMLADQVVPLSDTAQGMDAAGVQAVKNRVDARKWAASKFNPSAYGDKLDVTSKGEALAAPSHQVDARVQSIVMQAAMRMRGELDPDVAGLLE